MSHLFVASDGDLHDTRMPDWCAHPIRRHFSRHATDIRTTAELRATLRAGGFAWPGGYPLYLLCHDGGTLCFDCAREPRHLRQILEAIHHKQSDGWRVIACAVNYEDAELFCEQCSKQIEPAYGD